MSAPGRRYDGFLPGRQLLDAYGAGGFRFADMSHKGSVLMLPSGVKAWAARDGEPWTAARFTEVMDEHEAIELLLVGSGKELRPLPEALRLRLKELKVAVEVMATPPAARTYNILVQEGRKVAAALIAVE